MQIGCMRVIVCQPIVTMRMRVRLRRHGHVRVRVMLVVVGVKVLVLDRLVGVNVAVLFAEQQPDAAEHDQRGNSVERARPLVKQRNRRQRADERRGREQRRFARGAQ